MFLFICLMKQIFFSNNEHKVFGKKSHYHVEVWFLDTALFPGTIYQDF